MKNCLSCGLPFTDATSNQSKICCSKRCVCQLWYKKNLTRQKAKYQDKKVVLSEACKHERLLKRLTSPGPRCGICQKPLNANNLVGFCTKHRPNTWYQNNKARRLIYDKEYAKKNRELINKKTRDRRASDVNFDIACSLRERLKEAVKGSAKVGSAVKDLGCPIPEFKVYIESKFQPGMTWDNWGLGHDKWHLDHVKPLVKFDLTDRSQFLEACHYTNLQPLWARDHYIKSSRERHEKV